MRIYGVIPNYARNLRQQNNVNNKQNVSFGKIDEESRPYLPKELFEKDELLDEYMYEDDLKYLENAEWFTVKKAIGPDKFGIEKPYAYVAINKKRIEKEFDNIPERYYQMMGVYSQYHKFLTEERTKEPEHDLFNKDPEAMKVIRDIGDIDEICSKFEIIESRAGKPDAFIQPQKETKVVEYESDMERRDRLTEMGYGPYQ